METLIYGSGRGTRKSSGKSYKITKKMHKFATLRFRRCGGDMTNADKLLTNKYDNRSGLPSLQSSSNDRRKI